MKVINIFLTSAHLIFLITSFLHFHLPPFQFSLFNFPLSFISSFFFLFSPSFPFIFHLTPLYSELQQKFSLGKQTYYFTQSQLLLLFSHQVVSDCFITPQIVAHQDPLSIGYSRKEYQNELTFPSPGDFPDPGIKPPTPVLTSRFFTIEPPGKPLRVLGED